MNHLIDLLKLFLLAIIAMAAGGLFQYMADNRVPPWVALICIVLITLIFMFAGVVLFFKQNTKGK